MTGDGVTKDLEDQLAQFKVMVKMNKHHLYKKNTHKNHQ